MGRFAREATVGAPVPEKDFLWLVNKQQQFRELADISVLWHDGAWYMYPSVDMAWVSKDGGANWQHQPLNIRDVGYAPTIVKHKGKFLLMASESSVYTADAPTTRSCIFPGCLPWGSASKTPFRFFKDWVHQGGIATPLIAYWLAVIQKTCITDQSGPPGLTSTRKKLSAK